MSGRGEFECFYFGCWGTPGHYLFGPQGSHHGLLDSYAVELFGGGTTHIDGSLAPRKHHRTGEICFGAQGWGRDGRRSVEYASSECPQGQFLLHHLSNGYTAIQWWDCCQGDKRGACNSTILLKGNHTAEEMLQALRTHFPRVLENLTKAGVALVQVEVTGEPPR